jgi:hypothetical protein
MLALLKFQEYMLLFFFACCLIGERKLAFLENDKRILSSAKIVEKCCFTVG